MKARKDTSYRIAFVVDEARLRDLWKLLQDVSVKPPSIQMTCSDEMRLSPSSLTDVLEFPNTPGRAITRLTFETDYSAKPHVEVTLRGDQDPLDSVRISFNGEDKDVLFLENQLEN
jgi:hypothetical protein